MQRLREAHGYRFFSSSLLVAFDGKTNDGTIDLKMIDFAHSTFNGFMNDTTYDGPDEGYLLGLDSLINLLNDIIEKNLT